MKMQILNSRGLLVLSALGFLCASSGLVAAQGQVGPTINLGPLGPDQRMGGGGGGKGAAGVTTVKSSKSNTSNRMGGGSGGKGAVQLNPQPEPPGRR
jgi:hypothetical protein